MMAHFCENEVRFSHFHILNSVYKCAHVQVSNHDKNDICDKDNYTM